VIAWAIPGDPRAAPAALDAGAVGFLRKDTLTLDIVEAALTAAVGGAIVVAPSAIRRTRSRRSCVAPSGPSRTCCTTS